MDLTARQDAMKMLSSIGTNTTQSSTTTGLRTCLIQRAGRLRGALLVCAQFIHCRIILFFARPLYDA